MEDVNPQRIGVWRTAAALPGGTALVAHDDRGRRGVVKLHADDGPDGAGLAEARRIGLRHPGLVACLDVGRHVPDGRIFTVSEFVEGVPLAPGLAVADALRLARALLAALQSLHEHGLLHRDLKAGNVLVERRTGRPVIIDFGLSCPIDQAGRRVVAGTPRAMAPELFHGRACSVASDLWAAGLLLAEALSGRELFTAREPSAMAAERAAFTGLAGADRSRIASPPLVALLERLLDPDPDRRPVDAAAALAALPIVSEAASAAEHRERLDARLSGALAAHDLMRERRLQALQRGAQWIDVLADPEATPDALCFALREIGSLVPQAAEALRAQLEATANLTRTRPAHGVALARALARQVDLVFDVGAPDEGPRPFVDEIVQQLEGESGVEVVRRTPLEPERAAAVAQAWVGSRAVIEQRLRDAGPLSLAALDDALQELQRLGGVRAGAEGVAVDETAIPAGWPAAGSEPAVVVEDAARRELLDVLAISGLPLAAGLLTAVVGRDASADLRALEAAGLCRRVRTTADEAFVLADARLRRALGARAALDAATRARLALQLLPAEDEPTPGIAAVVAEILGPDAPAGADGAQLTRRLAAAAGALRRAGRLPAAVILARRACAGAPDDAPGVRQLHIDLVDTLIRANAHDDALAEVGRARERLGDDQALLVREARVLLLRGRADDCARALQRLEPDALPRDDALLGLQIRAMARQNVGHLDAALADVHEALRRAGDADDRRVMPLLERLAAIEESLGRWDDATRHYEACIAMARRLGHEVLIGSPLYNMGRAIRMRGEKRRGLALMEEGAQRMEAAGDHVGLATALNGLGSGWLVLGHVDLARRHLARALALGRRLGDEAFVGMVLNNSARALAAEGRLDEARDLFDEALLLRTRRRDRRGQAAVRLTRARLAVQRGRLEEARGDLDAARVALEGLSSPEWETQLDLVEARWALARGEPQAASASARAALARAGVQGYLSEVLEARDLLGRARADALMDIDVRREEPGPWLADLLFTRAGLADSAERAQADAEAALAILADTPDGPIEARGLLERARRDLTSGAELLSAGDPDYGRLGELLARVARDLDRARTLVDLHDLQPLRQPLDEALGRSAALGESGDVTGLARLAERLRMLERLSEINKVLNSEHDTQRLLDLIVDSAIELTGAARGFLILFEGRAEEFRAARCIDESTIRNPEFEVSHSTARRVAKEGRPILTANAIDDPRLASAASISELRLLSILCVPLVSRDRTLGAIYLDHPRVVGRFDERHLEVVTSLAGQAAIALQNARLSEGLARSNDELRTSREEVARLNERLQARLVEREAELETVRESLDASRRALALRYDYSRIITRSPRMHEVLDLLDRITDTDFPVIIQGESGTGKELLARAIHYNGARRERNFLSINCAAIAEPLIESELFGSVRGAFTGADRDRKGLFEQAHEGTLFLDEIGDMSLSVQKRLLRVLQEGEFLPVGGRQARRVDVRILCATHRDLSAMVAEGTFREDLFYRLAVARVRVPPLRERSEDIALLVPHFLAMHDGGERALQPEALRLLEGLPWPGNVRELENLVMNLLLLDREGGPITAGLVRRVTNGAPGGPAGPSAAGDEAGDEAGAEGSIRDRLTAYERSLVLSALRRTAGNKAQAAKELGVGVRTLYKMLARLGLDEAD